MRPAEKWVEMVESKEFVLTPIYVRGIQRDAIEDIVRELETMGELKSAAIARAYIRGYFFDGGRQS